jgi:hypothetical protein
MSPTTDTGLRCFHCDAVPTLKEMGDGWCDSCGKRLPDACAAEAKRHREAAAAAPVARARSRSPLLWGVAVLAVAAMAAVALAM